MTTTNHADDRVTKWARRIARVIGSLTAVYWLSIYIFVIVMDDVGPWTGIPS